MNTKHIEDCKRIFKRYDINCPRCQELANGAKPRAGWNDHKIEADKMRSRAIEQHRIDGGCEYEALGVPCIKFDW